VIGDIQWPIPENLYIDAKILQMFFSKNRVIAYFVSNFVAMATGVGRGKLRLAAFDGSPKSPL